MELPFEVLVYLFKYLPKSDRKSASETCQSWLWILTTTQYLELLIPGTILLGIPSTSRRHSQLWIRLSKNQTEKKTNLLIHSPQYPITDSELLGILSENVLDELETDNDGDSDPEFFENAHENAQEDYVTPGEAWFPGNPTSNITEFQFLKTPGLKEDVVDEPINYFDALCSSNLLELLKDCSNEYGEIEKKSTAATKSRKKSWKPVTSQEMKLFFGLIFSYGIYKDKSLE
ncbi:unnamed protein product, partial [Iphiclides podalirius]